mgnify:CR=1 FL=1
MVFELRENLDECAKILLSDFLEVRLVADILQIDSIFSKILFRPGVGLQKGLYSSLSLIHLE